MLRTSIVMRLLSSAGLVVTACQIGPPAGKPSLGYLEHRGVRHGLRELTEPDYRAASGDTFARGFDIDTFLATRDASMPAGHDASAETTAIWMGR